MTPRLRSLVWDGEEGKQLAAEQTSSKSPSHREGTAERGPFVSEKAKSERQPIRERSHRT
jgi:hypothetical protein